MKYFIATSTTGQLYRGNERVVHSTICLQIITSNTEVKLLSVPIRKINSHTKQEIINEIGNRSSELLQCEIATTFFYLYTKQNHHIIPIGSMKIIVFQYEKVPAYYSNTKKYQSIIPIRKNTSLLFQYEKVPVYYSSMKKYQSIIPIRKSTSLLFQYEKVPVYYSNTKKQQSSIPMRKSTSLLFQYEIVTTFIPMRNSNNCYSNAK